MQNKMSFVKATMIQCGCEKPKELHHLTCKQRKTLASTLIRLREGLLKKLSLEECNEVLALIETAEPENTLEAAYGKLISVLMDLDCVHCCKKQGAETCDTEADLFEDLTDRLGCEYMSNMKYEPYRSMAAAYIVRMDDAQLHYYPLRQYEDFAASKYGAKVSFPDYSEVIAFFRARCMEEAHNK